MPAMSLEEPDDFEPQEELNFFKSGGKHLLWIGPLAFAVFALFVYERNKASEAPKAKPAHIERPEVQPIQSWDI
jgi:hypothetical protein